MKNKVYYVHNPSSERYGIPELQISVPPGVSNLFDLNNELTLDRVQMSIKQGSLNAAFQNGLISPIPDPSLSYDDITIRNPLEVQVLPNRTRFTLVVNNTSTVFSQEDANLFEDEDILPARELEAEIANNALIEKVEATVLVVPPPTPLIPVIKKVDSEKAKNDAKMGYNTCNGIIAAGTRCMRRAKKDNEFCGLHQPKP